MKIRKGKIIIYTDHGVDGTALRQLVGSLHALEILDSHQIIRLKAAEIKTTAWEEETALFIMPGGRDVPYMQALGQEGCGKIKKYVEAGGRYLGLCAGAYFACSSIEFEKGGAFEVIEPRFLEFFPGKAVGPALGLGKYCYISARGVEPALISWKGGMLLHTYFNGGCYFENSLSYPSVETLSHYLTLDGHPAAIVLCHVGKGKALLSGVHLEYRPELIYVREPHLASVKSVLEKDEKKREFIFQLLISSVL